MPSLAFLINRRFEHQILALMLASLHLALWWDFGSALSRSLILAHLGLFLMWQPLWRREQRLNWKGSIVFILATLAQATSSSDYGCGSKAVTRGGALLSTHGRF